MKANPRTGLGEARTPIRPKNRLWERVVRLACVVAMVTGYVPMTVQPAYAAAGFTGGIDMSPSQYILNDHTAYAFHVSGSGLPANTVMGVSAKLSDTGTNGGFQNAPGFTWNGGAGRWIQSREAESNDATIAIDGSGVAVPGWYYFKCGDESFTGFPAGNGHGANQAYLTVQIQVLTGGSSYNPTVKPIVTVLDARTQGAWVHNGVATGAQATKRAEALKSDETSVSYSLQRTEANLSDDDSNGVVDDENYGPAGATGDFRFGVPSGVTMNIKLNSADWAAGQGVTAGPADTDIAIGASDITAPAAPGDLHATPGDNSVTLGWSASTDAGSGVSGYMVYRLVPGAYGEPTLQTSVPRLIGIAGPSATGLIDATAVNGTPYTYLVRAVDAATNVSARSNQADATPFNPDGTPPAAVTDLATTSVGATSVDLRWTAPGDDGAVGTAAAYDLRYATTPITDDASFDAATPVAGVPAPQAAGSTEAFSVTSLVGGTPYYFALKTRDDASNWSALSNVTSGTPGILPAGTMSLSAGAAYTATTAVTIDSAVAGAVDMRFREFGGTWSDWTAYAASVPFALSTGDGLKTVEAEYRNDVGEVTPLSDSITLDTVAPTGTMAINSGASYTTTKAVTLDSAVTGATEMRKRNLDGGGNWGSWTAYSASVAHSLQQTDGTKTVEAQYRDAAGNVLDLTDTIVLDTVAPMGTMAINNGASYTTTRAVTLNSAVTGATQMRKRNVDGGGSWSGWTAYSASVAHSLQQTDGLKTAEVQYADDAGNVLDLTDTITLDSVAPIGTMSINSGVSYTSTTSVSVDSSVAGATEMRVREAAGTWSGWTAYAASAPLVFSIGDGLKTAEAQYRDAAGNVLALSDTITLDTSAPTGTMSVNAGAAFTTTGAVTVGSSVTGAVEMRVRDAAGDWSGWASYAAETPLTLSAGDGLKTVEAEYRNFAGNVGALSDTITRDETKPTTGSDAVALYAGSASITLTPDDGAGSGIAATWYRFSDGLWTLGTVAETALPGDHVLEFYSIDNAGNQETTQTAEFRVSAGPPVTTVSGIPAQWTNGPVTFTLRADSDALPVSTFYAIGDGDPSAYGAPVEISAEGTTDLSYFSRDAVAQTETTKHATIRIDNTPPSATHSAQSVYTDGSGEIGLSGSDALSWGGLAWTLDGSDHVNTSASAQTTVTVSSLGQHTLTCWAYDLAGNESAHVPVTFSVKSPAGIGLATRSTTLGSYGARCSVVGSLTADGAGLAGERVILQSSPDNRTFADTSIVATTGVGGTFSLSAKPSVKTYYKVRFATTDTHIGLQSSSISVLPRAKVSTPVAPKKMYRWRHSTVYGYLWPRHTSGTSVVRIYEWRRVNGKWKSKGYVTAKVHNYSTYSKYSKSVRLPYNGKWRLRAYHVDSGHAGSWSSGYDYVTVF